MLAEWDEDLPTVWRNVLGRTQLDLKSRALDHEVLPGEVIFPSRKGQPLATAPIGAHLLRAFEGTTPDAVRAVILGQDPYSNPAWATGRAFEQGNLVKWPDQPKAVADSLRRLVQVMVAARTGDSSYAADDHAWSKLIEDAHSDLLRLELPCKFFDRLERAGVLFLNTSLTISILNRGAEPKERHRHFQLWAPLIHHVLSFLAIRKNGHAVFLLLGQRASDVFDRSGARIEAVRAGTWKRRVDSVRHFHPAAITAAGPAFLRRPNPFVATNQLLRRMGAGPISW
jgi:uracil-DNA glycosylase